MLLLLYGDYGFDNACHEMEVSGVLGGFFFKHFWRGGSGRRMAVFTCTYLTFFLIDFVEGVRLVGAVGVVFFGWK